MNSAPRAEPTAAEPSLALDIRRLDVLLFRAPAEPPVQTSFGVMAHRPALLLRVIDADGAHGWGECWCNFPAVGAEHRARMARYYLPATVCEQTWDSPRACTTELAARLAVLALQSGEPGPLQQILAALDVALWDLVARRCGQALWRLLQGASSDVQAPSIPVYASGLNPTAPEALAAAKLAEGYRAFKLKVGFGDARDEANLRALRQVIGADLPLMVDANQGWDVDAAIAAGRRMAAHGLGWLEEPIRADAPQEAWARVAAEQPLPLAAGENLAGHARFEAAIRCGFLQVIQPDIGKWGGFSGCLEVGRQALAQGRMFCPHWLGAGIGLTASLHLKAAVGGPGYVEVDANPNALREGLAEPPFSVQDGAVTLGDRPGLGVEPDLAACRAFQVDF